MRVLKLAALVAGIIGLTVAVFVVRTLWLAGAFSDIDPIAGGTCKLIPGTVGSEDLTIHPRTGVAYISSSDRRALLAGQPIPGAIYALDLNAPVARLINLTPQVGAEFQPHGLSLWLGDDGRAVLFVINHPPDGEHGVEIFDLIDGSLMHRTSLRHPLLVMPNDLVAVGADRFYLTNTHRHPPGTSQDIETYLRLSGAQVLFYDGQEFRVALDDVVMPNGINVSPDGRTLYLASLTTHRVLVYERDPSDTELRFKKEIYLGSGPDNIEVAPNGIVWVAAHAKLMRIAAHRDNPSELSPSQVFRITPDGAVTQIYANRGEEISAASVAAEYRGRLLIGQIFGDGVLACAFGATGP